MSHERDQLVRLRVPVGAGTTIGGRITRRAKAITRTTGRQASMAIGRTRAAAMRAAARRRLREIASPIRLCLGSGAAPIEGWINVDFEPPADVLLDIRFGLPLEDGSVDAIYSEHLVEHLPLRDAQRLFRECHRVLKADGVMRVATPDLEAIVEDYRHAWRDRNAWVNWPQYAYIDSPVHMINVAVREWGHQYLYDFDEIALRLTDAGFGQVVRLDVGVSDQPELRCLETRADSRLVVEARPGSKGDQATERFDPERDKA